MVLSVFVLFLLLISSFTSCVTPSDSIDELTNNLATNLRNDPFVLANSKSPEAIEFIDKQFDNYEALMFRTQEKQFSRSKRSLGRDKNTTDEYFVDLKPFRSFEECADLLLFEQKHKLYAACLKKNDGKKSTLTIMKHQENSFELSNGTEISNGIRIAVFPLESSTLVIVAENCTTCEDFRQSNVFEFTEMEVLKSIQRINTPFTTDLKIWDDKRNIFMSVVQLMKKTSTGRTFRVKTPIYKWLGKHFDIIQEVETSGGSKITPFQVDGSNFLALANSQNDEGEEKVYSQILIYDLNTEKYKIHQNILTYACHDMKYFNIHFQEDVNHFLIVANYFKKDVHGSINYNTFSIIYKMVDNYFIPFQSLLLKGVSQWEPMINENGETLLIALTLNGLKFFQYDGWRFTEANVKDSEQIRTERVEMLHIYNFEKKSILGIQSENKTDLYVMKFSSQNELKQKYDEMLSWCQNNVNIIEEKEGMRLIGERKRGDSIVGEMDSASQVIQQNVPGELLSTLNKFQSQLSYIEGEIEKSYQSSQRNSIMRNIRVRHLVLRNDTSFEDADIQTINELDVGDLLDDILNINDGFTINSNVEFDNLRTEESIFPETVNDHLVSNILRRDDSVEDITVIGSVIFKDDFKVEAINDITIDIHNILLNIGNQTLGNFSVNSLNTEKISADELNDRSLESIKYDNKNGKNKLEKKKIVDDMKVENLVVGGFIDDVHIPTLHKYALMKKKPQVITQTYYFDSLEADSLVGGELSGIDVSNTLVPISGGTFLINKDVIFEDELFAENLTASQNLNNIKVMDGNLDVLLRDSNERQYVSGTKSFENLELLSPIKLNGKIRGEAFGTMSPLVKVDQDVEINADVRITGNAVSEGTIRSKDIIAMDGKKSWGNLLKYGFELSNNDMPIHLVFSQHINVDELSADIINSIETGSWLVNGAKQTQIVHGSKQFDKDLEIRGDTTCRRINDIDVVELENNVLRKDGDQIITGKHYVKYVATEKMIHTNSTEFGKNPWKEVLTTSGHQVITGIMLFKEEPSTTSIVVDELTVNGHIFGADFKEIVKNAVNEDFITKIIGKKSFKNLRVDDLKMKNLLFDENLQLLAEKKQKFNNMNHLENISVQNLHFVNSCNNVSRMEMANINETKKAEVELYDEEFSNIKVFGNVFIESNHLNEINLDDLHLKTVKIDETHRFGTTEFTNDVIVSDTIALDGHVDNLDLDNIFPNEVGGRQTILDVLDKKHFHENVTILGAVHINGNLNGVNVSDLCGFASDIKDAGSRLILEGNAFFAKGPHIHQFNGELMKNLEHFIWLSDREAILKGNFVFQSDVTFKDNVHVQGLINDVSLYRITQNYLSKTKDQNITARMNFNDGIVFYEDIETPEAFIKGKVNDIEFPDFSKNVLLNRPQLFEEELYFEETTVQKLEGDYSVNKLNLDSDVIRYDRHNMITGSKTFRNLTIGNLKAERNITLQDVNVLYWLANAVLNNTSCSISGKKMFNNLTSQRGLGLIGQLNDVELNKHSIMMRTSQQNITGHKSFEPHLPEKVQFKAMKIKKLINRLEINEFVNTQAHRRNINYIKSPIMFNNVSLLNLNCEKTYQGLNISELLKNITNLATLNNFTSNYRKLLDISIEIEQSLDEQALYLNYFMIVPYTPNANEMFAARCDQHESRVLTVTNEKNIAIVKFFDWNRKEGVFVETVGYTMDLGAYPTYTQYLNFNGYDYIYFENEKKADNFDEGNSDQTFDGHLIHFSQNTSFRHNSFLTKGTIFITSFSINIIHKHCLLFIDYDYGINILCKDDEFYLHQTIESEKAQMASVLNIQESPYLVTARIQEPRVAIWHLQNNFTFEIFQTFHEGDPISLSTISCQYGQFIAVAYGHLPNTKDYGRVVIRKFNSAQEDFIIWQIIKLKAPMQIEFALLPSQELVLFITTANPTEPFVTYILEGISGFSKKIGGSAIHNVLAMNQISLGNEHFTVAKSVNGISIIQAVFKGKKSSDFNIVRKNYQ